LVMQSPRPGDLLITAATVDGVSQTTTRAVSSARLLVLDHDSLIAGLGSDAAQVTSELENHLAERLRSLRDRHQLESLHDAKANVIAVLSPKGGAGTTTVAVNIAAALAKEMPRQVI